MNRNGITRINSRNYEDNEFSRRKINSIKNACRGHTETGPGICCSPHWRELTVLRRSLAGEGLLPTGRGLSSRHPLFVTLTCWPFRRLCPITTLFARKKTDYYFRSRSKVYQFLTVLPASDNSAQLAVARLVCLPVDCRPVSFSPRWPDTGFRWNGS